jgi:hypothetical protein
VTTARYFTAQQVMDQAAIELGLSAPGATVYSSTDTNIILLRNLLNMAGQTLALQKDPYWPALVKEHTITVANPGDTGEYTLPTDFNGLVPQTGWNRTNDTILNPISAQVWQYIKTGAVTATLTVNVRFDQDKLRVETVPDNGTVLAFEYLSRYWAAATATPTVLSKATCTVSTDVIFFEPIMIVALLKLRYREARGEDTTAALVAFERAYDLSLSSVVSSQVLSADGRTRGLKLINAYNVPDGGYG